MKATAFRVDRIIIEPDKGVAIDTVVREALCLALDRMENVEFSFNGTPILLDPKKVIREITSEYWKKRDPVP